MDRNLIKSIWQLAKSNRTDAEKEIIYDYLAENANAPNESIIDEVRSQVNERSEGVKLEKNEPEDLVDYIKLAAETGYSASGVRSAIDTSKNGFKIYIKGKKRYISRAAWAKYCKEVGTKTKNNKKSNRLAKNWHPGGPSKEMSNHEIRGWMTIPQCAVHTAVKEITLRNSIRKGMLTTVKLEGRNAAPDVYGIHADEVYSIIKGRGPRYIPDVTVFERWSQVTTVAEVFDIEQTNLSKAAKNGAIASHRIGRYLYVHIGEIEKWNSPEG